MTSEEMKDYHNSPDFDETDGFENGELSDFTQNHVLTNILRHLMTRGYSNNINQRIIELYRNVLTSSYYMFLRYDLNRLKSILKHR